MLDYCIFRLVLSTYNISLTALLNKTWVSRVWSPTKFGLLFVKLFLSRNLFRWVPHINYLIRVVEKRALHLCSRITRPSSPSVNFGYDCSRASRSKRFLQNNVLHAFCMSFSCLFVRGKIFASLMSIDTINLLKNCAFCRTISLLNWKLLKNFA